MKINTKYEIGQQIWIVYDHNGEVHVYDDYIVNFVINESKQLLYCSKCAYEELKEEEIILYEELDKLAAKIQSVMKEIRENESNGENNKTKDQE